MTTLALPTLAPVREFAGLTGKGRTPEAAIVGYLTANPDVLKKVAHEVGIPVPRTGPTEETAKAAAKFV